MCTKQTQTTRFAFIHNLNTLNSVENNIILITSFHENISSYAHSIRHCLILKRSYSLRWFNYIFSQNHSKFQKHYDQGYWTMCSINLGLLKREPEKNMGYNFLAFLSGKKRNEKNKLHVLWKNAGKIEKKWICYKRLNFLCLYDV